MNSFNSVSSSSKSAKWSLIFGIVAVVLLPVGYFTWFFIPYLGWAAGLLALILGIKALRQTVTLQGKEKIWATWGTIIGVISIVYFIVSMVVFLVTEA